MEHYRITEEDRSDSALWLHNLLFCWRCISEEDRVTDLLHVLLYKQSCLKRSPAGTNNPCTYNNPHPGGSDAISNTSISLTCTHTQEQLLPIHWLYTLYTLTCLCHHRPVLPQSCSQSLSVSCEAPSHTCTWHQTWYIQDQQHVTATVTVTYTELPLLLCHYLLL